MKRNLWIVAGLLASCASSHDPGDTIKVFEGRQVAVERDVAIAASRSAAIHAYQKFLDAAPRDRMRPEAMRRLGDLEIEKAQEDPNGMDKAAYRNAVKVYENLLKQFPTNAGNDRVLYQLSSAYDQVGDLERSLLTLSRLTSQYPTSPYWDEAEFRRGETLFTLRRYPDAEAAYARVLKKGDTSPFEERALYMHGWSLFKQAQLEDGLGSFFGVLDRKLVGRNSDAPLNEVPGLSRADREMIDDTFRVVSLSLVNLQGAETIPRYFNSPARHEYEFRVYEQLGELYTKQERVEDAAQTFNAFARRYPTHVQSPFLQSRAIRAYQDASFGNLAIEAKKEFVTRYGVSSEFRRINGDTVYERIAPLVKAHTEELARHYHALAQKGKKPDDYAEATRWYRVYLTSFPQDAKAPEMNFLMAELLYESGQYIYAAREYEKTAYEYPRHAKSADAGYAALLAYGKHEKTVKTEDVLVIKRQAIESALRFAEANNKDPRVAGVLTDTAEKLYAVHDPNSALAVSKHVLALQPEPTPEMRRTVWTVIALVEFQQGAFDRAETAYREVLVLAPANDKERAALTERLAASIYKQGEQARSSGRLRVASDHFLRVGLAAPNSPIRVNAEYDATAALIELKDWDSAAKELENFRQRYPTHPLQAEIPGKLAVVYLESGQTLKAANEFDAMAKSKKDVALSRDALWQAAELYAKAGREDSAANAYERYVRQNPTPLEPAIEARYRLAEFSRKQGKQAQYMTWSRELFDTEQKGGNARTDRTRYLGSLSALVVAEPLAQEYRSIKLVEPLKKNLKLKKDKMQRVLQAYGVAAEYGVAETATPATYQTAMIYQDFGKSLMDSQRPKGLSADEIEQYNVMLEEQAYPFEEKAIELHEINAQRTRKGIYDEWVKKSFIALSKLRPVRYAKAEKGEKVFDAIQ